LVNLKTKSAGDGYSKKAIEKTVLRFLGSRTFSQTTSVDLSHWNQGGPIDAPMAEDNDWDEGDVEPVPPDDFC
jgi:hypothetical protein